MEIVIKIPDHIYKYVQTVGYVHISDTQQIANAIFDGTPVIDWLNSFDASSATKCFEAVNILKERLEGEDG